MLWLVNALFLPVVVSDRAYLATPALYRTGKLVALGLAFTDFYINSIESTFDVGFTINVYKFKDEV